MNTAIEVFSQHLRPLMPGDIEDLVNWLTAANPNNEFDNPDKSLNGVAYRQAGVDKWKGPYLQWTADASGASNGNIAIFQSRLGAQIHFALHRCPVASTDCAAGSNDGPCTIYTTTNGNTENAYVVVKPSSIPPAAGSESMSLNDVVDGKGEVNPASNGLLRQNSTGNVFFLAAPYTAP